MLESFAYIAEIVAAAAVIPSLIYLAVQVRQGNLQGQATARYAFIEAMADINTAIGQDKQVASVWRRGLADPDGLDDDEVMQLWMFVGQYCNAWMVMYHLRQDGLLPDNHWRVVRNDILAILGAKGGRAFWRMGRSAFDEDFTEFIDRELLGKQQPYDMLTRGSSDNFFACP